MTGLGDQPKASWTDAILIALLVSFPIAMAAQLAGASSDVCVCIFAGATAALFPVVFMILRARRRREWMKEWEGPAHMYRAVPRAPAQVAGDWLIEDRGYLQRLLPGYRYQFADDPSGYLLRDFVLLGTWAGIMEFLEKHQEQMIENNSSIPGAGIYIAVEPYRPIERYKVSGGSSVFVMQWLADLLSSLVPVRNPATDLVLNPGESIRALKQLREDDDDSANQKPGFSPWTVFAITFSVLDRDKGFHFIGDRSVDFGSIRQILERAS